MVQYLLKFGHKLGPRYMRCILNVSDGEQSLITFLCVVLFRQQ